jgi:hypothetical protein
MSMSSNCREASSSSASPAVERSPPRSARIQAFHLFFSRTTPSRPSNPTRHSSLSSRFPSKDHPFVHFCFRIARRGDASGAHLAASSSLPLRSKPCCSRNIRRPSFVSSPSGHYGHACVRALQSPFFAYRGTVTRTAPSRTVFGRGSKMPPASRLSDIPSGCKPERMSLEFGRAVFTLACS